MNERCNPRESRMNVEFNGGVLDRLMRMDNLVLHPYTLQRKITLHEQSFYITIMRFDHPGADIGGDTCSKSWLFW